jgi:hypothetical protein
MMTYNELTEEQQSAVDAIKKITNENEDFLTDEQIAEIDKLAEDLPEDFQPWIGELLALYEYA